MDTTAQILSALIGAGIVIMIAPRVLASNRGVALRNIAIWAAIFLLLALAYTKFGPHEQAPLTQDTAATSTAPESSNDDSVGEVDLPPETGTDLKDNEEFSPPNEE